MCLNAHQQPRVPNQTRARTVCLSPWEIITDFAWTRIEDEPPIKWWRVFERKIRKVGGPSEDIVGGKQRSQSWHDLWLSSVIQGCRLSNKKATRKRFQDGRKQFSGLKIWWYKSERPEFVRFSESKHNIGIFLHEIFGSVIHEFKSAYVIGFSEFVLVREPRIPRTSAHSGARAEPTEGGERTDGTSGRPIGKP
jgi:hypothetical protein